MTDWNWRLAALTFFVGLPIFIGAQIAVSRSILTEENEKLVKKGCPPTYFLEAAKTPIGDRFFCDPVYLDQ